jgi:hypothetical protein
MTPRFRRTGPIAATLATLSPVTHGADWALANGALVEHAANEMSPGSGQAGLGLRQKLPARDPQLGAYLAQFHVRVAHFSRTKSRRAAGAPFLPPTRAASTRGTSSRTLNTSACWPSRSRRSWPPTPCWPN